MKAFFSISMVIAAVLPLAAQQSVAVRPAPAVPLQAGERMSYQVTLGPFGSVGEGALQVVGTETLRGHETYRLRLDIEGKVLFAKVDTRLESWVKPADFTALRFFRDQHEVNYKRKQTVEFYPDAMEWRASDGGQGPLGSKQPLDDVSFLYYARQLPLEVGKTYTLSRYWKVDGNPVVLKVVGKEKVTVPAGTFNTIVVQPVIQTSGLFSKGGEARVYFTDDDRRILVQIKSKVPVVGDLSLKLKGYQPGDRPTTLGANF